MSLISLINIFWHSLPLISPRYGYVRMYVCAWKLEQVCGGNAFDNFATSFWVLHKARRLATRQLQQKQLRLVGVDGGFDGGLWQHGSWRA